MVKLLIDSSPSYKKKHTHAHAHTHQTRANSTKRWKSDGGDRPNGTEATRQLSSSALLHPGHVYPPLPPLHHHHHLPSSFFRQQGAAGFSCPNAGIHSCIYNNSLLGTERKERDGVNRRRRRRRKRRAKRYPFSPLNRSQCTAGNCSCCWINLFVCSLSSHSVHFYNISSSS